MFTLKHFNINIRLNVYGALNITTAKKAHCYFIEEKISIKTTYTFLRH